MLRQSKQKTSFYGGVLVFFKWEKTAYNLEMNTYKVTQMQHTVNHTGGTASKQSRCNVEKS